MGPSRLSGAIRVLRRAHAPATFFQSASTHPAPSSSPVRRRRAGEVGNHTLDDDDLAPPSAGAVPAGDLRGERAVATASGAPLLFLPPYDVADPLANRLVRRAGLSTSFWSVDSRDWQNGNPRRSGASKQRARAGRDHPPSRAGRPHHLDAAAGSLADLKRRSPPCPLLFPAPRRRPPTTGQLEADRRGRTWR